MEPAAKRMRITNNIWDILLDFIDEHPEMATGKFMGPNAKHHMQKLWTELSLKLNALGCGNKTPIRWQKSFADWKYNVKQKYAEIKTQHNTTGGGPQFDKKLIPQEERLISLVGRSSMEGDGTVEEIGLRRKISITTPHPTEPVPSTSKRVSPEPQETWFQESLLYSPDPIDVVVVDVSDVSRPSSSGASETVKVSKPATPLRGTSTSTYHQPARSKEGAVLERFQAETMDVLTNINSNLTAISDNIQRLTDALIAHINKKTN